MNKLTKLLSVFVLAGAVGASIAGVAGCKKGNNNDGNKHTHHYTWEIDPSDNTKCREVCDADGECDAKTKPSQAHVDEKNNQTGATGADGKCDHCGTTMPETPPAEHVHNYEWTPNDENTHNGHCSVEGCDVPDIENEAHEWGPDHRCVKCRTKQPAYNITFNMHGEGTAPEAQEVYAGDTLTIPADPTSTTKYFGGWYENADYTGGKFDFTKPASKSVELHARWLEIHEINTAADFVAFRTAVVAEDGTGGLEGAYVLKADIDLTGVELVASSCEINDGIVFDGAGHTISNGTYSAAPAKTGLLCKEINGGVVTNVKFLNCAVTSTNESAGLIAGEVNDGVSVISKVEFNSCSVNSGNYGGLIAGRNEGSTNAVINISEITAKNGCVVQASQYGGFLVGDECGSTTINFKDLHIDGEFNSGNNGAFLAGRCRGGSYSFENCVISAAYTGSGNSNFIFAGGSGAPASLTIKNVLVIKSNMSGLVKTAAKDKTIEKLAAVEGVTVTDATATDGQNTVAYLTDTLGFDFTNVWMAEGTNGYRLKAASTNVKSADAKLATLKVGTGNAKLRFKKGEDFSSAGLAVMGAYSDGVQLVLTEGVEYEVVSTNFDKNTAGDYEITVHAIEEGATAEDVTYEVTVVAETGFTINHEFMPHVYLRGDKLDSTNLVLYSTWSDGTQEKVAAKDIKIVPQSYNMTTAGKYEVMVAYKDYPAQRVTISVIDTKVVPVDGKLYINVDPTAVESTYSGAQVNGVETFANVADAIDYLEACKFDNSVQKVIRIAAGDYRAKITTNLDNLTLIGLGEASTDVKLTYDAVESTVDPLTGAQYAMNCATLHINGKGFKAYNVFFDNSFDYVNDQDASNPNKQSSPQGFALTINGDGAYIENCYLHGHQDTLFLRSGRSYFKNTTIEGNTDFIFGEAEGLAYFDSCTIKAITRYKVANTNNGYVTAMRSDEAKKPKYGYIFANCAFTDDGNLLEGSMSLGRPWGANATVAMINCSFTAAYSTHGYKTDLLPGETNKYYKGRWEEMSSANPADADFVEFGSTGEGAITTAVAGGKVLASQAEADKYTAANMFGAENSPLYTAAWDYAAAGTLLAELKGALATEAGTELYVSAESVTVAEEGEAELLISRNPWNLDDKGLTIAVGDTTIAEYYLGKVVGIAEGETTITVSRNEEVLKTINVTVTSKDPTIREATNWTFGGSGYEELTAANTTKTINKMKINTGTSGSFIQHSGGSKYYKLTGDANIEFTVSKGSVLKFTTYGNELLLKLGGNDVTDKGSYNGTSDCVYTYQATEDGVLSLSLAEGKAQLYLTKIDIVPPIVTTTPITTGSGEDTNKQLADGEVYKNMIVDVSAGNGAKVVARKSDIQVTAGAVLQIPTVAGSTVAITWYNADQPEYGADNNATITYNADKTLATITFHADTVTDTSDGVTKAHGSSGIYVTKITVTCPKTEFSYLYKSETNGTEWVATNCVDGKVAKGEDGQDDPDASHVGLQINDKKAATETEAEVDSYLDLEVSGTKATINSIIGYTLGTNNASQWLVIEFLDADNNVLDTVKGTTTAKKLFGEYTLEKTTVETTTQFVKIRFRCVSGQSSAKSIMINSVSIKAE